MPKVLSLKKKQHGDLHKGNRLIFKKYVEYDFTAQLEEFLDNVSAGEMEWKKLSFAIPESILYAFALDSL